MMSIKIQSESLVSALSALVARLNGRLPKIIKECAGEFLSVASKYTPPNIGKVKIERRLFSREVFRTKSGAFKVFIKRPGKKGIVRISRKESDLKKYLPIHYRGFARVGWIAGFYRLGIAPKNFNVSKDAMIKGRPFSVVRVFSKTDYELENTVPYIQSVAKLSVKQGVKGAKKHFERKKREILK